MRNHQSRSSRSRSLVAILVISCSSFCVVTVTAQRRKQQESQQGTEAMYDFITARDSCNTLHSCLACVGAGCSWTQSFVAQQQHGQQDQTAQVGEVASPSNAAADVGRTSDTAATGTQYGFQFRCLKSCDGAGTDASCFLLDNYVGLDSSEICQLADFTTTTTTAAAVTAVPQVTEEETPVAAAEQEQEQVPVEAAEQPEEEQPEDEDEGSIVFFVSGSAEYLDSPTDVPTTEQSTSPPETPVASEQHSDDFYDDTASTNTHNTSTTPIPIIPTKPCVGFISCEHCRNDTQLACAFVASGLCRDVCPELGHVPCYEFDGNYSDMTKADVCASIVDDPIGGNGPAPGFGKPPIISTNALAATSTASHTGWGFGDTVLAASMIISFLVLG